jgi:ABC-type dipeptide/oligopeptide/nickel transport system permease component
VTRYLTRRLVHAALVVLAVLAVVFVLIRLGGDPTPLFLPPTADAREIAATRHALGFDRPLYAQFVDYLGRAVRGDFGVSLRQGEPAMGLVLERIPATLRLTALAFAIMLLIALPIGVLAAVRRNSFYDLCGMLFALVGQSIPTFWLGIVLILFFAVKLRWFPAFGSEGVAALILPGITLGMYSAAIATRLVRSGVLEVLPQDFVRTARAKGLSQAVVLCKHTLPNASIPVITVLGLQVGTLLGGAIITEQVFAYPGMGRLALQAIGNRDMPVVQAFVVVTAAIIAATNLAVDVCYSLLDPRIRYT